MEKKQVSFWRTADLDRVKERTDGKLVKEQKRFERYSSFFGVNAALFFSFFFFFLTFFF